VAYLRGGPRCDAPLWSDHENFLQATLYEKVRFCHFPARIANFNNVWWFFCVSKFQKKWGNLRFPLNIQKQKVFQLQGTLPPDLPTRGSAPGPRWGPGAEGLPSRPLRQPCAGGSGRVCDEKRIRGVFATMRYTNWRPLPFSLPFRNHESRCSLGLYKIVFNLQKYKH